MKIVSFAIAKIIREAGYPQEYTIGDSWCYENGQYPDESELEPPMNGWVLLPAYLEVWLWLWREKKKRIEIVFSDDEDGWTFMQNPSPCDSGLYQDPEEAIIESINYLIENNLMK